MNTFELFSVLANVSTAATFLAGLFFFWRQNAHQRTLSSAQTIVSVVEQYNPPEFRGNRRDVAEKLYLHQSSNYNFGPTDFSMSGASFENICYLSNSGAVDRGMMANIFGFAIFNYFQILKYARDDLDVIELERKTGPDTYKEIEKFYFWYLERYPDIKPDETVPEYLSAERGLPR